MYRIFLVEDDGALAKAMQVQLESYGHSVEHVRDFQHILDEFNAAKPDLVLMDIMLPFRDGYYFCTKIRKISKVPIVFISSASENMNIVMAVSCGGDDFIPKPVDPMVLCAKVNAVLRRTYEMREGDVRIPFAGGFLNPADNTVSCNEQTAELTKTELRILKILLENRGKIVTRDALMLGLWQDDQFVEENTLTKNVGRLRKKLEECGLEDAIVTKSGSGYMIK